MKQRIFLILGLAAYAATLCAQPQQPAIVSVGGAPKGEPMAVAARVIKSKFPDCKQVSAATRLSDGSIRASCDGADYRIFTMYSPAEEKMIELVLNCTDVRGRNTGAC